MSLPEAPKSFGRFFRASPFLMGAAIAHILLALAWWRVPSLGWFWLAGLLAIHLFFLCNTLRPRSAMFGKNITQLPTAASWRKQVALTFDDGPDPQITPVVLDLLDAAQMRASFFVKGERVEKYPALAREIVRRGHSLENHTFSHPNLFSLFGFARMWDEMWRTQKAIIDIGAPAPRFFRPPAGFRSPLLMPLLPQLGLIQATWTRRGFDTRERDAQVILRRLTRNLAARDILLLHDANAAKDEAGEAVLLRVLPALLEALKAQGLKSVTLPEAFANEI